MKNFSQSYQFPIHPDMKHIVRSLSICLMFFLFSPQSQASHFQGGDISYSCLSGCNYRITLTRYFECPGVTTPPPIPTSNFNFSAVGICTPVNPTPLTGWVFVSEEEVTPLAPNVMLGGTTCSGMPGAAIAGVVKVVYYMDYDFCSTTCPVEVSLQECCRDGDLVNIVNPNTVPYEILTEILEPTVCNQSPEWLDPSYTILDDGIPARISMAAYDADGDSLVYGIDTLFVPYDYSAGYYSSQPFGPTAIPTINSQTGDLFIPNSVNLGNYAVGVSVKEYRDGVHLGTYFRDFTVSTVSGISGFADNPYLEPYGPPSPNPIGATYVDSFIIQGFTGSPISLPLQGLAPGGGGDTITMTWSQNLPGATFTDVATGLITDTLIGSSPTAMLNWTPTKTGQFAFNIKLRHSVQYSVGLADHSFVIMVDTCDLMVDIGFDSLSVCPNDTAYLTATVTGGASPYVYTWSNGETTPNISTTTPGTYIVWVMDNSGCTSSDTIIVDFDLPCVWPGDADNDGIADVNDLLALGLTYGNTGAMRPSASLAWISQPATAWNDTLPSGVNSVFCDTDGSGLVDADDTLAISQNYGLTHSKRDGIAGGPGDPLLVVEPSMDSVIVGSQVTMAIVFGMDTLPATDVYGLAFTIQYDASLVDSASANIEYNGWLGTYSSSLLGIQKDHFNDGEIDVALTRTDKMSMTGYGAIAHFSIVMIDDIAGKNNLSEILKLDITNVRAIGADGVEIPVNTQSSEIVVVEETSTGIAQGLGTKLNVYPQPAQDQVFIELETSQGWEATLYTLSGQAIQTISTQNLSKLQLSLAGLPSGLYLLRVKNDLGQAVRKLEVMR